jgi:myo-inositol-1-phosphate synthase
MATGKNGNGARLNGRASRNTAVRSDSRSRRKVRVAILGVGNCASSLVQGVEYYRDAKAGTSIPGLMHVDLGGYHIRDIEFSAAFDVDRDKVGKRLDEAIFSGQNNTIRFSDVPRSDVVVQRGMTHDGLGKYLSEVITKAPGSTADIVGILQDTGTDVVVNYLPVGSEEATKWYTEQVLTAGCALVNCMPVFIAREEYWRRRFEQRGAPIIGDDIKSQVGATIVHRVLTRLFRERGVKLENTYQLNFGGNTDFLNMLERERLISKKISKTNSVISQLDYAIDKDSVHIGPSDYVPWLRDRKWAYIRLEGRSFGDAPLNLELKLEVHDSPNSAGIVIDAVRCCKLALDQGIGGALDGPSAYFMKSPPHQVSDAVARQMTEDFIAQPGANGHAGARALGEAVTPSTMPAAD